MVLVVLKNDKPSSGVMADDDKAPPSMPLSSSADEEDFVTNPNENMQCFLNMFNREMQRVRREISHDMRFAREGWETPYKSLISTCLCMGKNHGPLTEALDRVSNALQSLNDLAESEMVDLQLKMAVALEEVKHVRE